MSVQAMSCFAGAVPTRSDEWLTAPATHAAVGGWEAFDLAAALLFLRGRQQFCLPTGARALRSNGSPADAGAPSVLCAYGHRHADVLAACGLDGQFVALRFPRGFLVAALSQTWREIILDFVRQHRGPIAQADLYRLAAAHPRARSNQNVDAKVRQILNDGPFRRVARGQWETAL